MASDVEVLIVGAGIGGLTAALSLHSAGFGNITVVEAAPELRPLGVGLNILPNAICELTELGVFDAVTDKAVRTAEFILVHRSGGLIWREPRGLAAGHRFPQLSIHRGHLQSALVDAVRERLGAQALRTDCRVIGIEDPSAERVWVTLRHTENPENSTVSADVVIGADGLHSAVRGLLYPKEGAPCTNGMVMWRGTTWGRPYLTGASMFVIGDDRQKLVVYPIVPPERLGEPTLINWVTGLPAALLPPGGTDPEHRRAEVLRKYGDWRLPWLDIAGMVSSAEDILEYPMLDRDPLPRWAFNRVVLLGDAAHPMYPVGSNGATQAIVDGRAVAYYLATVDDPAAALVAFEADRLPKMTKVQAANRQMGPERAIDVVHGRAPEGFVDVHDVMSEEELAAISREYSVLGGFTTETLSTQSQSPYATPSVQPR